jgi:hypothetical protein
MRQPLHSFEQLLDAAESVRSSAGQSGRSGPGLPARRETLVAQPAVDASISMECPDGPPKHGERLFRSDTACNLSIHHVTAPCVTARHP